jgi:glycosyltransferase involved in cell wall biosynthesis
MNELARRRKRFDLMLFHSPNHDTVYASCLAGRVFGWKTIYKITLWGSDDLSTIARSGRIGHLRLATLTLADGFISMSRVALHPYEDQPWICSRLLVAPQGVDLKRFYPRDPVQKRSLRRQLGIPEDKKVVLFCGALIYRKGVDVLIDAWQQVRQQFPDALLLLVGPNHLDGIDEHEHQAFSEAIAHRIMDLKLTDTVRLLGYQRETSPYYAAADVFVLPSRSEGWGTVITEAMASGLPCVISSLHGISEEHLEDNVQGFIVPSHAPKDYAERLLTLLSDETIARRMGKNARSRAEEHFTVERVADQYTDFFRRIVANPRPRKRWTVLS